MEEIMLLLWEEAHAPAESLVTYSVVHTFAKWRHFVFSLLAPHTSEADICMQEQHRELEGSQMWTHRGSMCTSSGRDTTQWRDAEVVNL